jgi:hypothetical protein
MMPASALAQMRILSLPLSITDARSSSRNHIGTILTVSPQLKMAWIHAWRIVAFMQNEQPFWDCSVMQNPGSAMGTN